MWRPKYHVTGLELDYIFVTSPGMMLRLGGGGGETKD